MMVMIGNDARPATIDLAKRHVGKLGWLISTSCYKNPREGVPFALDNGAFSAYKNGTAWDEKVWLSMLEKVKKTNLDPVWVAVPDVVANRDETLRSWERYAPIASEFGWPLAFVAQDKMTPSDVPENAAVIFIGGTTSWKLRSLYTWTRHFPRVHVGRVNTIFRLQNVERAGAESCDGTGWFRKTFNGPDARKLRAWLEGCNYQHEMQLT